MKAISRLLGLLLLLGISAIGQEQTPTVELFAGYSALHQNIANGGFNLNGGSASVAFNPNRWLGVVADVGGYHGSPLTTTTYLFGPRFSYRSKSTVTPFAQVLFGAAHTTNSGNAFAMTVGGGLDLHADSNWGWRIVQAEYLFTNFNDGANGHQHNARISTGVTYSWD